MFGVKNQRYINRASMQFVRFFAVEQVKKMTGGGFVIGLNVDAPAVNVKVVPVEQHGAETSGQPVGHGDLIMAGAFGLERAKHRTSGAHDVHRMRAARNELEHGLQSRRQAALRAELGLVFLEFGLLGEVSVDEQISDFLEGRLLG